MTTIIYHRADPDGWFSNTVCREFLPPDTVSIGWDYGDKVPDLPPEGDIYMVDISVEDILDGRTSINRDRVIWIDHHKTAIERWDKINLRGLRVEGVAACRLCWAWFTDPKYSAGHITVDTDWSQRQLCEPEVLFLVGLRDVWKHTGTPVEHACNWLNFALIAKRESEMTRALLIMPLDNPNERDTGLDSLLDEGAAIERYADSLAKEHADRGAMIRQWKGLTFAVLNSQARGSKTLEDWANITEPEVHALLVWAVGADGRVNVSLYHAPGRKDIDLSLIAKKYGGGGHPGACGFKTDLFGIQGIIEP